jgi:hypothetical protein
MRLSRKVILGGALVVAIAGLGLGQAALEANAAQQSVEAPRFEVDPFWPKPLPNGWVMGQVIGVGIDSRDHVFIIHRSDAVTAATEGAADQNPPLAECCKAAPPIIEFDPQGNLVKAWGGPVEGAPYTWPGSNHGIAIDRFDNVWIGGNGQTDSHILKFSRDGKFLAQYGQSVGGVDSKSKERFGGVAKLIIDEAANEVYVADGYRNKRVAVLDENTGAMKRMWGAYGKEPVDVTPGDFTDGRGTAGWSADKAPAPWFRNPVHCAEVSSDGFVYVCDRQNNRIQVFRKDGTFVKESFYAPTTLGDGSTWDLAFSREGQQKYMYLADGKNDRVWILDRQTLAPLSTFGAGGRYPGQFQAVHSIATDSQGNIYTTETYEGRRVQRFVNKGITRVTKMHQGTPWPATALGGGGQ